MNSSFQNENEMPLSGLGSDLRANLISNMMKDGGKKKKDDDQKGNISNYAEGIKVRNLDFPFSLLSVFILI